MLGWQQHSFGHEGKTRRSRRAEPTPVWSCWRGVSALCDITQGRNPEQCFLPRKCVPKSAARKREGWTLLLSGDFSGRIEITSENTSGRRPLSRLRRSPSAFYSLSRMLFAAIPTQIGPKAVMHSSVFILEMFGGGVWAAKSEKGLTFLLGH